MPVFILSEVIMLQLNGIGKVYKAGEMRVEALKNVSLSFERGEFVAVLGPSGCGKTTLLNIIGGLDRYDSGDLRINGRSTKEYSEREMDAYRNHSVGFVFQTYNLIPHQSVLANVELALTLSGVGRAERLARAREALDQVGLKDQLHKRPNQLSGGQMQRVAIARALVNDPDVLLADEPTGALDTATSIQVLELLKELAKDRLVIMVTHNQELAKRFASRIVELKDGEVSGDSRPVPEAPAPQDAGRPRKTSMGYRTALSLSFNNLLTKRGRTLITAFAGSIGIIGIALILALSNGVNQYIINVQKDTMSAYPIVIQEQTFQIEGMVSGMRERHEKEREHGLDAVYVNAESLQSINQFQTSITQNNLTAFKEFADAPDSPLKEHVSEVRYGYNASFDVFALDPEGELVGVSGGAFGGRMGALAAMLPFSPSILTELLPSSDDGLVGEAVKSDYTLLAGEWPRGAADLVLILDKDNEIQDMTAFQLGLLPQSALQELLRGEGDAAMEFPAFRYEDLLGHTFRLLAGSDFYVPNQQGLYRDLRQDPAALKALVEQAPVLTISGIVRLDNTNMFTQGGLGYTRALTDSVVARSAVSPVVAAQQNSPETSLLTGLRFAPQNDAEKAEDLLKYVDSLSGERKTEFALQAAPLLIGGGREDLPEASPRPDAPGQLPGMSMENIQELMKLFPGLMQGQPGEGGEAAPENGMDLLSQWMRMPGFNLEALAGREAGQTVDLLDAGLLAADEVTLAKVYDQLVAPDVLPLQETLREMGLVDLKTPSSISLYMDTFEQKDEVARIIREYNEEAATENQIAYTDYVALMISSVTTIINAISYVLIAFVAVSLVVSSIMIGIITYISVLERIKEIGILRAVGASRKDVRRVFTSEAFIIGLAAGILGIVVSALLTLPINSIVHRLTDDAGIKAILPLEGAFILIAISALLSLLAGWLPARIAAKKDPVVALRTE